MTLVTVRHQVKEYAAWRKIYGELAPVQKTAGVIEESVYQDKDNPNDVLVLHRFANRAKADAFLAGGELREAMQRAGLTGSAKDRTVRRNESTRPISLSLVRACGTLRSCIAGFIADIGFPLGAHAVAAVEFG